MLLQNDERRKDQQQSVAPLDRNRWVLKQNLNQRKR